MNYRESNKFRFIQINAPQSKHFVDNNISTTKYNRYTFLPLFLFDQFRNYSNIFFLIISIVQQIPGVSPMGWYTTALPLTIILSVTALKEIIEDIFRHLEDKKMNNQNTEVWRKFSWRPTKWKHLQVGQFVRVHKDEGFPADLLLVSCSDRSSGTAYVDTVNLDGESNLKARRVPPQLLEKDLKEILFDFRGVIMCDQPNEFIYRFNGMVVPKSNEPEFSINHEQLMLKGAILKNTEWICGICVYTGVDTKIWNNSRTKHLKRSTFDIVINWHMTVLFVIFIVLTISNSIMCILWNYELGNGQWYLPTASLYGFNVETFLSFAIGYSITVPISLKIYCEIVHIFQANFINKDKQMYDESSNKYAQVRTSALNADLGVVKYIFTDKTGTLTQNKLVFKACSIEGKMYSSEAVEKLAVESNEKSAFHEFFIAICVMPGVIPIFDREDNQWKYYSSSVDQVALVTAAKQYGFELRERTYRQANVLVHGKMRKFEILSDIEFTSERKCSTVIVRNPAREIVLYMLGADETIYSCLSPNNPHQRQTSAHINTFNSYGLRTMCLATTVLQERDFEKWNHLLRKANLSLTKRREAIGRVAEKVERNLRLLGATGQEDKLQDQVPETILTLMQAGIKIWILTGDKQETAVNIGYSSRLLHVDSTIFVINSTSLQELRKTCVTILDQMNSGATKPCLVVNGSSVGRLISSDLVNLFMQLVTRCDSVIFCRMIPLQKAQVVSFIQNRTNYVTLAIGDGANDVAMIQTAAIGVGISGFEGLQAARAADYTIAQFKYLHRLLLVHGTLNYYRMGKIILYIYYKNLPVAFILFYMSYASGWSGATIFDDCAFSLYNVVFTDGATLVLGAFEKDFSEDVLLENPNIYRENDRSEVYLFYAVLLNAVFHTIFIIFLTFNISRSGIIGSEGYNENYMIQGNMLYTHVLIVAVLKCMIHLENWTWYSLILIAAPACLWFPFLLVYNSLPLNFDMIGIGSILLELPLFWVSVLVVPFASLLCDIIGLTMYRTIVANADRAGEFEQRKIHNTDR